MTTMTREVEVLDCLGDRDGVPACGSCGCPAWIVDGHDGRHWLLCLDLRGAGCVETRALPGDVTIIDGRTT